MLQPDPLHRPSINEILGSEWMMMEHPTQQEVDDELAKCSLYIDSKLPEIDVSQYFEKA